MLRQNTPSKDGLTPGMDESNIDKSVLDHDELSTQLETANQLLADRDLELISFQTKNSELETKLQKLQADFSQVRTKAQEMLVQKDSEIKRLREKTIGGRSKEPIKNANNSGIDSDADDIISQVYQSAGEDSSSDEDIDSRKRPRTKMEGETIDSTSRSFIKTVLVKYLECQAN